MPKSEAAKRWQRNNRHKSEEYNRKFLADKKKISITLEQWVTDAIDKFKPPEQTYGAWARQLIESWVKSQDIPKL